jgi:hypothetical protein
MESLPKPDLVIRYVEEQENTRESLPLPDYLYFLCSWKDLILSLAGVRVLTTSGVADDMSFEEADTWVEV